MEAAGLRVVVENLVVIGAAARHRALDRKARRVPSSLSAGSSPLKTDRVGDLSGCHGVKKKISRCHRRCRRSGRVWT
jgi:hypothetical protein